MAICPGCEADIEIDDFDVNRPLNRLSDLLFLILTDGSLPEPAHFVAVAFAKYDIAPPVLIQIRNGQIGDPGTILNGWADGSGF